MFHRDVRRYIKIESALKRVFKEGIPIVISPRHGFEYLISKKNPELLMLSCNVSNDVNKIYWYINDLFYKMASARMKQFLILEEGSVKISCPDDKDKTRAA